MKANFALSLSSDGIRLLHRAAGGWKRIGEVSLEDPDFPTALTALRETAQGIEPLGLRTKLIIPSEQIKYLTIETPQADDQARRVAAQQALDGATPYPVVELAFDISPDCDLTHIATVAKETLAEAETFAANFGFVPISAVAVPGTADFLGEPFFGATQHAASILEDGAKVEPDQIAVVEIDPSLENSAPVVEVVVQDPTPAALNDHDGEQGASPSDHEDTTPGSWVPVAPSTAHEVEPFDDADYTEIDQENTALAAGDNTSEFADATRDAAPDDDPMDGTDAGFGFATRRSNSPDAPVEVDVSARPETGRISLNVVSGDLAGDTDTPDEAADERSATAGPAGFASRRLTAAPLAPKAPTVSPTDRLFASRFKRTSLEKPIVALPGSEQQRMTVFGARKPSQQAVKATGSRFVGLALVAVMLLGLVGVAAWATVFREDGLASFFSAPQVDDTSITLNDLPTVSETAPIVNDVQTASLELDTTPPQPLNEALAQPEADVFDPDAAEAHYAVTGIWSIPPNVPQAPTLLGLDDLYITSIDGSNLSFDAVALMPTGDLETDVAFRAPSSPAPSGTQFSLDDRGLVIPTAQGAVSPEGVIVFLGKPPSVPPATPDRSARTLVEPDVRLELAAYRPKIRPAALIENTERTQLGGLSREELAAYRPKIRPQNEKQKAEEDETPTAQAAVASKRPSTRPRGFDRVVARARQTPRRPAPATPTPETPAPSRNAAPDEAPDKAPRRVAALAPRTVTPSVPSSATTAKQATIRRAINLNRINLMGVYGTPSNRRALVRLSNGRYKKVKVGDRIDGGKVSAIGEGELRYQKGARNIVLKMPKT